MTNGEMLPLNTAVVKAVAGMAEVAPPPPKTVPAAAGVATLDPTDGGFGVDVADGVGIEETNAALTPPPPPPTQAFALLPVMLLFAKTEPTLGALPLVAPALAPAALV